jgi:hypothetical protein
VHADHGDAEEYDGCPGHQAATRSPQPARRGIGLVGRSTR